MNPIFWIGFITYTLSTYPIHIDLNDLMDLESFLWKFNIFGKYNWFSYATEILCNGIPIWLITQAYSMTSLISFINYSFVSLNSQFCHEFRLNQGFAIFWQSESTWRKVGVRYFAPIYSIYSVAMKYGTSKIYSGRK